VTGGVLRRPDAPDLATTLRQGILGLAALGLVGTAVELVFLRHWSSALQLVVWPTLVLLFGAWWAVGLRPTPVRVRRARWLALSVLVIAALGVVVHVWANLDAGPLDQDYETTWATLPAIQQWFLAITGGVGPAPVLAPGVLAEIALAIGLATVGHPAIETPKPAGPGQA
jgi:hypothetical protein